MRSYLLLAAVASAFVAPQRALQRVTSLRAAPEVSEQQSWMIDYMAKAHTCLLYTSPSPRDMRRTRMPSSA